MRIETIRAGALEVAFAQTETGISLASVTDHGGEKPFRILSTPGSLFCVTVENKTDGSEIFLMANEHFPVCSFGREGSDLILAATSGDPVPGVTVRIRVSPEETDSRLRFTTAVESVNDDYILTCCDYPCFWFDVSEQARFLSPYGCGEAMKADDGLFGHEYRSIQEYPSYGASFQFMAYWNPERGRMLYYGLEDPKPVSKRFCFLREKDDAALCLKAAMPLQDPDRVRNGQTLAGTLVWQLGDGDWYDATLLYRAWMEKEAGWLPERTASGRTDSAWLEEIDAWWLVHINGDSFADEIIEAAKDLGVPSAVHLYLWHQIPFDNDYPHYFPEKGCVRSELKKVQDAGIRVIPYINGRLWDTRDRGTEDWMFSKEAKPFATKDRFGKIFTESYSSKESDGSPVVLSIMCPSTAFWQNTVRDLTGRILDDVGFDGVYLDQIAAAKPQLCADPSHGHPAGGGSWWSDSYNDLLRTVKEKHPDRILATECTAEMFMKDIQAYLSWLWVRNDQVPAFPVLYSDKVHLFGIAFGDPSYADIFIAQSLLFGEQMGWMSPAFYWKLPHRDFYKKAVAARTRLHRTLSHGRMLRPPVLTDDAPRLRSEKCPHAYFKTVDYPAVQGTQWLEKETGNRYLLLANAGEENAHVTIETDFPDGDYSVDGIDGLTVRIRSGKAEAELPGLSVGWLERKKD